MSWLARLALKNRSIASLAVVAVVIPGTHAVTSLKEELPPDLTCEFGTDIEAREAEVQRAVSGIRQALPQGTTAPEVAALHLASLPVVQLAVTSDQPTKQVAALLKAANTAVLQVVKTADGLPDVMSHLGQGGHPSPPRSTRPGRRAQDWTRALSARTRR